MRGVSSIRSVSTPAGSDDAPRQGLRRGASSRRSWSRSCSPAARPRRSRSVSSDAGGCHVYASPPHAGQPLSHHLRGSSPSSPLKVVRSTRGRPWRSITPSPSPSRHGHRSRSRSMSRSRSRGRGNHMHRRAHSRSRSRSRSRGRRSWACSRSRSRSRSRQPRMMRRSRSRDRRRHHYRSSSRGRRGSPRRPSSSISPGRSPPRRGHRRSRSRSASLGARATWGGHDGGGRDGRPVPHHRPQQQQQQQQQQRTEVTLFVGDLPPHNFDAADLCGLFEGAGLIVVSARVMGASCFGFVEFRSREEAAEALALVSERDPALAINGAHIRASWARGSLPAWKQQQPASGPPVVQPPQLLQLHPAQPHLMLLPPQAAGLLLGMGPHLGNPPARAVIDYGDL